MDLVIPNTIIMILILTKYNLVYRSNSADTKCDPTLAPSSIPLSIASTDMLMYLNTYVDRIFTHARFTRRTYR